MSSPKVKQEPGTQTPRGFLVTNDSEFVCPACESFLIEEQGVILQNCQHNFCRPCLIDSIKNCKVAEVVCPMNIVNCDQAIREQEIQALLPPQEYIEFITNRDDIIKKMRAEKLTKRYSTVPKLMELENLEYVETREIFVCAICLMDIEPGDGLMLKNCLHEYCKGCLSRTIETSDDVEIRCPFVAEDGNHCEGILKDSEMRALITPAIYDAHLIKSLQLAEAIIKDSFHCKSPDCPGWAEIIGAKTFLCQICDKTNCIECKAIHEGRTCQDYYYEINADARKARDEGLTEAQVKELIRGKQAQACPRCGVIIQKTAGCNHMTCSRCKSEFQWQGMM